MHAKLYMVRVVSACWVYSIMIIMYRLENRKQDENAGACCCSVARCGLRCVAQLHAVRLWT